MKRLRLSLTFLVILLTLTGFLFEDKINQPVSPADTDGSGFAVLELFTSEGCSSCPPADELMGRIQQRSSNQPVYVLAYHVDYWDNNGWKDVFSNAAFSERQYNYSRRFGNQVYTPQVVVNGKTEFVGSDAAAADAAINNALKATSMRSLSLSATRYSDSLTISYHATGNLNKTRLMIAVVQKYVLHNIKAGENKGRILTHWQTVRALHNFTISNDTGSQASIELPADFNSKDWEVIGFLQERNTGEISAASRVRIDRIM